MSDPQTLTTPKEEIDAKGKWVVLDFPASVPETGSIRRRV